MLLRILYVISCHLMIAEMEELHYYMTGVLSNL